MAVSDSPQNPEENPLDPTNGADAAGPDSDASASSPDGSAPTTAAAIDAAGRKHAATVSKKLGAFSLTTRFLIASGVAGVVAAGIALPLVGGTAFAAKQAVDSFQALPDNLATPPLPERTYMQTSEGTRFATLYDENRIEVPLSDISPYMQQAIVAIEDNRFYEHDGVDAKGTMRALVTNSSSGGVQQGGSTLTQQYVKNVLITNAETPEAAEKARERSVSRKLQEMRYALALEKDLSKQEILNRYLNIAYFGSGAYGVEAAARRYFSTTADKLTVGQAATLAGIVQQPVGYDPLLNPNDSTQRRNVVLDRMEQQGMITAEQAAKAKSRPMSKLLNPKKVTNGCAESTYPFFCDYVIRQIKKSPLYGKTADEREDLLKRGGLVIKTTLNEAGQKAALDTYAWRMPANDGSQKASATATVDPKNGNILVMAQNQPWGLKKKKGQTTYNYAVNAADGGTIGYQAGSTFKAFALAAALEQGIPPTTTIESPGTKVFNNGQWGCENGEWHGAYDVKNSSESEAGSFNMRDGTGHSVNTFFVELEARAGLCNVIDVAERTGVKMGDGERVKKLPSFVLGSMEVTPLTVASAYGTFANHGEYCKPRAITQMIDRYGKDLPVPEKACKQTVDPAVADGVTALLSAVIDGGGTGAGLNPGRPAVGKTGTTDGSTAAWFAGYTPNAATAVWVGDPRGGFRYPLTNVTIGGNYYGQIYGATLPGPIWRDTMAGLFNDLEYEDFQLDGKFGLRMGGTGSSSDDGYYDNGTGKNTGPYGDQTSQDPNQQYQDPNQQYQDPNQQYNG